jgi:uncharacterized membrane protein YqjE
MPHLFKNEMKSDKILKKIVRVLIMIKLYGVITKEAKERFVQALLMAGNNFLEQALSIL